MQRLWTTHDPLRWVQGGRLLQDLRDRSRVLGVGTGDLPARFHILLPLLRASHAAAEAYRMFASPSPCNHA